MQQKLSSVELSKFGLLAVARWQFWLNFSRFTHNSLFGKKCLKLKFGKQIADHYIIYPSNNLHQFFSLKESRKYTFIKFTIYVLFAFVSEESNDLDDDDQFETVDDLINLAEEDETDPGAEFFESYPEEEDDEEVDENQLDEEDYEPTRESLTQRVEHHNENVHLMRKSNFMLKAKIDRLYVSTYIFVKL